MRLLGLLLSAIVVLTWPTLASADFVVVPNSLTAAEGNTALGGGPDLRLQQVYSASQFGGLGVIEITGLAFRPDNSPLGFAFGPDTLPGLQVRVSTTGRAPDGLSPLFADNVGVDDTLVFSGDWTRSSAYALVPGGTRAFDITLTFTTPFVYDPTHGNLLVDFINPSGRLLLPTSVDAQDVPGDSVSALLGLSASASGDPLGSFGIVTRFAFQPAGTVPEPSGLLLVGTGALFGLGCWLGRRARARRKGQGRVGAAPNDQVQLPGGRRDVEARTAVMPPGQLQRLVRHET